MPDIQLRFQKDMLVISAPIDTLLARQGVDASLDRQYLNLMEPDSIRDALSLEVAAGAQCVVTTTEDITRARLAHVRMETDAERLARAALSIARETKPQHVLVEIGPCGLPLDASSKSSLNENRSQYADAARFFLGDEQVDGFDAFFLNGFVSIADLKCAIMGVLQVADKPVFASVVVGKNPPRSAGPSLSGASEATAVEDIAINFPFTGYSLVEGAIAPPAPIGNTACMAVEEWPEAVEVMVDMGVSVVGFETADPLEDAVAYVRTASSQTDLPLLAQLRATEAPAKPVGKNLVPLADIDEYTPDTMPTVAVKLYGAGVQFVRATGLATPAYTGALAATLAGLDVRPR